MRISITSRPHDLLMDAPDSSPGNFLELTPSDTVVGLREYTERKIESLPPDLTKMQKMIENEEILPFQRAAGENFWLFRSLNSISL